MPERSLFTVGKDVLFALLNATLILLALCLWLAWQVSDTIKTTTAEFTTSLTGLAPIRANVSDLTAEIAALRNDLTSLQARSDNSVSSELTRLRSDYEALERRLRGVIEPIEALSARPELLVDYAIDRAASKVKDGVATVWQCETATSDTGSAM